MNEDELIELIQSRLPQDLTPRQIQELRRMMRTSPRLRDALLEELSLEQSLATRYAPTVEGVEEIVAEISRRARATRRGRWLLTHLGFVLALAGAVAGVLLVAHLFIQPLAPEPVAVATDGNGTPATQLASRPASAPATPTSRAVGPAVAAAGAGDPRPGPDAPKPVRPQPAPPTPAPPAPPVAAKPLPAWRLYDPLPHVGGATFREQFRSLFKEVANTYVRAQREYIEVRGRYALRPKLEEGQLLRLAPYSPKKLRLTAWRGSKGVRFARQSDETLAGYLLTTKGRDVPGSLAAQDPRWRYFARGALDLRYQDGNMVLARADLPLLALPLDGPPDAVELEYEGHLISAAVLPCQPLPLSAPPAGRARVDSSHVGGLTWKPDREKGVELRKHADGTLEILAKRPRDEPQVTTDFSPAVGRSFALQLQDVSDRVAFFVAAQGGRRTVRYNVVRHRNVFVLSTNASDSRSREEAYEHGRVVGNAFWVRVRTGLDCLEIDFSTDGRHWGRLSEARLESHHPADEPIQFGLRLPRGRDSRARLTHVRIEETDAFGGLADAALVARVPKSKEARRESNMEKIWAAVAAAKPAGTPDLAWRLACDAALVHHSVYPVIRTACAADLVETALKAEADTEDVLAAMADLARLTYTRDGGAPAWKVVLPAYEALARQSFSAGRRGELPRIADHWLRNTLPHFRNQGDLKAPLPPGLPRLLVYHLLAEADWDLLARESGRLLALYRSGRDELPRHWEGGTTETKLLRWAQAEARSNLVGAGDDASAYWSGAWTHPLTVQLDRETLNVIAEFIASVNAKAYEHAAKVLASQLLPDGIVPTDADGRLYQAIHFHIRHLIRTHPELGRQLRDRFEGIGVVRLQRALRDGDVATLESLVAQFHGTEPSRQALYRLADRDLSMGNVVGAAAKYQTLLQAASGPQRHALAAKFRLASALAGQLAGEPVTEPVRLGEEPISAAEFERMVASLAKSRSSGTTRGIATAVRPLAPPPGTCEVSEVVRISADREDRNRPFTRTVAWGLLGNHLLLHQWGRVSAIDLAGRKIAWSKQQPLKSAPESYSPAWPVVAGSRVYARIQSRREAALLSIDTKTGKGDWTERFDEGVLSDPILINSWLYVLTYRRSLGDMTEIYLRRVSPETGQSAMAARLVTLRVDSSRLLSPGKLTRVGEALVFRCAATLVCCDLLGQVRWLRRLTFVPPDIDRELTDGMLPGDVVSWNGRVLFASRACPNVQCVDPKTGRVVWSYLQPDLRRLVGLVGGKVILATEGHIEALDAETGTFAWQVERTANVDAVLPAQKDTLCCVTLDRVDAKNRRRYGRDVRRVRWLSAADGKTVRSEPVEDPKLYHVLYNATRLYSTGRELVCFATTDRNQRDARLFRIRVR